MTKNRRTFPAEQKAEIVRRHLKDKIPVSSLAEELAIQPTQIYQWVAMLLEQAARVFEKSENGKHSSVLVQREMEFRVGLTVKKMEICTRVLSLGLAH